MLRCLFYVLGCEFLEESFKLLLALVKERYVPAIEMLCSSYFLITKKRGIQVGLCTLSSNFALFRRTQCVYVSSRHAGSLLETVQIAQRLNNSMLQPKACAKTFVQRITEVKCLLFPDVQETSYILLLNCISHPGTEMRITNCNWPRRLVPLSKGSLSEILTLACLKSWCLRPILDGIRKLYFKLTKWKMSFASTALLASLPSELLPLFFFCSFLPWQICKVLSTFTSLVFAPNYNYSYTYRNEPERRTRERPQDSGWPGFTHAIFT